MQMQRQFSIIALFRAAAYCILQF